MLTQTKIFKESEFQKAIPLKSKSLNGKKNTKKMWKTLPKSVKNKLQEKQSEVVRWDSKQ